MPTRRGAESGRERVRGGRAEGPSLPGWVDRESGGVEDADVEIQGGWGVEG